MPCVDHLDDGITRFEMKGLSGFGFHGKCSFQQDTGVDYRMFVQRQYCPGRDCDPQDGDFGFSFRLIFFMRAHEHFPEGQDPQEREEPFQGDGPAGDG